MCKHPRLQRRGAVYWFRCRIPADLVEHYGKQEVLKSLQTRDCREAVRHARALSEEQEQEFDRIRGGRDVIELTAEQIDALAKGHAQSVLEWDEAMRVKGMDESTYDSIAAGIEETDSWLPEALATGDTTQVQHVVDVMLKQHGLVLAKDSAGYKRLSYAMLKAVREVTEVIRQRHQGAVIDTPAAKPVNIPTTTRKGDSAGLAELLGYWTAQGDPKAPKTLHEARTTVVRFNELHGNPDVLSVERRHFIEMRDALVKRGLAPATVKKQLGLLRSMFQVGLEDEKFGLKSNPGADVKVRGEVGKVKERAAFTADELQRIFSAPVFMLGERPQGGAGEAAYWIPLIGLYTGARLNEIGQLRVDDIQEVEGVTFFRITDLGEGQRLKMKRANRRRVPVHPELVRLGLLHYARRMRDSGENRLFPLLKPDSHGHLTGRWSRWFNRYLDNVIGIYSDTRDFYSFRHTFKNQSRACSIPEDVHDALTGHANATVARTYGSAEGYPLKPLAQAMERLMYRLPTL